MRERRFTPLRQVRQAAPSQLASLEGDRRSGQTINFGTNIKAPKRRFNLGDRFVYDGTIWELIYMYRIASEPGIWHHCIEERAGEPVGTLAPVFIALGAGATTPRIVLTPFKYEGDVHQYFGDIYRQGSSSIKTTQQLLQLPRA